MAEYDNWLGKSKQTWMETGFFGRDKYEEIPKLLSGDSYASDELAWLAPIYHWGGECLPQDVYEDYDRLVTEALIAESKLDSNFTSNDKYAIRQKVMFGKYAMRTDAELDGTYYEYPDYCTPESYSENYGQVWYNPDSNKYYDRGALDVTVYPSPKIRYTFRIETTTVTNEDGSTSTVTTTYFDAYYKIEYLSYHSDGTWSTNAPHILGNQLRLTTGPDDIVSSANLTNVSESATTALSSGRETSSFTSSSTGSTVNTNGKTGIQFSSSGLRICTDGGTNSHGSSTHQSQTAYTTSDGRYYDGGRINYIVNPGTEPCNSNNSYGYCVGPHHYNTAWGNCLATVQKKDVNGNPTGPVYFAVVGDAGHAIGEVSLALAKNMGYSYVSGNYGVEESEKFFITIYPDCKLYLNSSSDINLQIKQQGESYFSN